MHLCDIKKKDRKYINSIFYYEVDANTACKIPLLSFSTKSAGKCKRKITTHISSIGF